MDGFERLGNGAVPASRIYIRAAIRPGAPGIVVFHPWWGLNEDTIAYADRLADAGFTVVAPDMYGGAVETTVEGAEARSSSVNEDTADAIAVAAVDRLAERVGPGAPIAALGFSMGAAWAMWTPAQRDRLAASVVYYGSLQGPSLLRASVPVLGHFAESDPYEPDEGVQAFEQALRNAARSVTIHRYPGTGHWFAEPSRDAYRPEAADLAFERTVAFLREHLASGSDAPYPKRVGRPEEGTTDASRR
jgi:carboxymethylenebutenolidase